MNLRVFPPRINCTNVYFSEPADLLQLSWARNLLQIFQVTLKQRPDASRSQL
jgi:hypothetical protein